jgi:hypothetical protein
MLLALHASAVAAQAAAPIDPPQPGEKAVLEAEFYAAIGAEGETYRQFRDRILKRSPAIEKFLIERAENGKMWQERTMAWILLERVQKKAEVEALLDAKPGVPYNRNWSIRIPSYRDALVAKAKDTPMVLCESAWKGNRFVWGRPGMAPRYAVMALGVLKERRAVFVLIDYLQRHVPLVVTEESSPHTVQFACQALGALGDPVAVPALLHACSADPKWMGGAALAPLAACVDRGALRYVQSVAIYLRNPVMKQHLETLIKKKEAELDAKAKPIGPRRK